MLSVKTHVSSLWPQKQTNICEGKINHQTLKVSFFLRQLTGSWVEVNFPTPNTNTHFNVCLITHKLYVFMHFALEVIPTLKCFLLEWKRRGHSLKPANTNTNTLRHVSSLAHRCKAYGLKTAWSPCRNEQSMMGISPQKLHRLMALGGRQEVSAKDAPV